MDSVGIGAKWHLQEAIKHQRWAQDNFCYMIHNRYFGFVQDEINCQKHAAFHYEQARSHMDAYFALTRHVR